MAYNHSIRNTANDLEEQTKSLENNYKNLCIPLNERYAAILTHDSDTASRYASLFGDSITFTNSSDFEEAVRDDVLKTGKPLVLVSSIRLPIYDGGFSRALYENYEGATIAHKVRSSASHARHISNTDFPILLFGESLDKDQSAQIKSINGPLALYINAECNVPKKEVIEHILCKAEHDYFKKHFEPLFKAAASFNMAYSLTQNGR